MTEQKKSDLLSTVAVGMSLFGFLIFGLYLTTVGFIVAVMACAFHEPNWKRAVKFCGVILAVNVLLLYLGLFSNILNWVK